MRLLLAPLHMHPLFWVLYYHLRLTYEQIHTLTGISVSSLRFFDEGYAPTNTQLRLLYKALTQSRDRVGASQPSPKEMPLYRDYLKAFWSVVDDLEREYKQFAHTEFRRTELSDCLIALLKPAPQLRKIIVRSLKFQGFSRQAILNCARRIKVQECVNLKSGSYEWMLPKSLMTPSAPKYEPPRFIKATTPKRDQLHNKLSIMLGRAPKQKLPVSEIFGQLMKPNQPSWSRPTIMRAFREMGLLRHRTGFGPGSVTYWALPHYKSEKK